MSSNPSNDEFKKGRIICKLPLSIRIYHGLCSIFAYSISQIETKFFDLMFLFSYKCIFMNKDWEKSDEKSRILKNKNAQWIHDTFFHSSFDGMLDMVIVARLG